MATYKVREMKRAPMHPGELLDDILETNGISARELARQIKVTHQLVSLIVACKRPVTCGMALRLERFFGGSAGMWTRAQSNYDAWHKARELDTVLKEIKPLAA